MYVSVIGCMCMLEYYMITRRWLGSTLKHWIHCRRNWMTLKLHCDWKLNSTARPRSAIVCSQ